MIALLKKYLKNCDALLISSHPNIKYLISDFGFSETEKECLLLITKNKNFVITDKRYSEAIRKRLTGFEIIDYGSNYFITKAAGELFKENGIKSLGYEKNNLTVEEYNKLKSDALLVPVDLSEIRTIKTPGEIKNIKQACKIADLAFDYITEKLKSGVSEREIEWEIEKFFKEKNAEISFKPIVAFGKNSSVPHHLSGGTKLKENQIILLDFGAKVNGYCSDMTRTIFFGKAPKEFKDRYHIVLEAQTKAIEYANNGKLVGRDIDNIAREYIKTQSFPSVPHSIGHGIGIEVHESPHISPSSKTKIEEGMVFSIEPGIYIENWGGIRIEDLVLATKNGLELISHAERSLIEI